MKVLLNLRAVVFNILFRQKRIAALSLLLIFLIIQFGLRRPAPPKKIEEPDVKVLDILKLRRSYVNPIYQTWEAQEEEVTDPCGSYFEQLTSIYPGDPGPEIIDLESILGWDFDRSIYREKLWIRRAKREYKKQLRLQGSRFKSLDLNEIKESYNGELTKLAQFEKGVVEEFGHKRVFGKCFLQPESLPQDQDAICSNYQRKLYPWISPSGFPKFENWKRKLLKRGEVPIFDKSKKIDSENDIKCMINHWKSISNGKGIVIPILPDTSKHEQMSNIIRLIKVLRILKNTLPIEITYANNALTKEDKAALVYQARTEISGLPESYHHYLRLTDNEHPVTVSRDFPKQELWFADLTEVLNKQQHPLIPRNYNFNSPNFMNSLSTIFNSFEEVVMLSSKAIPLKEDFAKAILDNDHYKKYGQLFFKNPSRFKSDNKRLKPGLFEVNDLVKDLIMPSVLDQNFMNLKRRAKQADTNIVFDDMIQNYLDPTVIVINKSKHLSGLLLSCSLQLYNVLGARFEIIKGHVFSDFLWLGLEISGLQLQVYFNKVHGVAAGVLTPTEKKPYKILTSSHELCSASWGQVDDFDSYNLLYVTSHQLENWLYEPLFQNDLTDKFILKKKVEPVEIQERAQDIGSLEDTFNKEPLQKRDGQDPALDVQQDQAPQDQVPQDQVPQDQAPQDQVPQDQVPHDQAPQDQAPQDQAPQDQAPQDQAPQDQTPQDQTPQDQTPQDQTPQDQDQAQDQDQDQDQQGQDQQVPEDQIPIQAPNDQPAEENMIEDRELYSSTIEKNPLFIQAILKPPAVIHPVHIPEFREPKLGWFKKKGFGGYRGHTYWCAYDIVGSPQSATRGRVEEYGLKYQARYNYILDVWLE